MSSLLDVIKVGLCDYQKAWDWQRQLHAARRANDIPDTLLLLQHPSVYTFGKNANKENLIDSKDALVIQSDRGGDITWHGPGQLVGYPIINLKEHKTSASWYMRNLEEVIIRCLKDYDISASRIEKLTGVWIGNEKIAAMGVRLSRWITMHGFALNIAPDLSYFNGMIPCGIKDKGVTSIKKQLGKEPDFDEVQNCIIEHFKTIFNFDEIQHNDLV